MQVAQTSGAPRRLLPFRENYGNPAELLIDRTQSSYLYPSRSCLALLSFSPPPILWAPPLQGSLQQRSGPPKKTERPQKNGAALRVSERTGALRDQMNRVSERRYPLRSFAFRKLFQPSFQNITPSPLDGRRAHMRGVSANYY